MNTLLNILKKFPWWFWVVILVAIFFFWQSLSGWAYSNKLWNMVKREIVSDQLQIIEELERQNAIDQKEKEDLYRQVNNLKIQRSSLQKEREALLKKVQEITNALQNVSVPNDPDDLVRLLHTLGLRSAERRSK